MTFRQIQNILFIISGLAICAGLFLTIISWLRICSIECATIHYYRLYGLNFEIFGFLFFSLLMMTHFLSRQWNWLGTLSAFLLATAVGSEVMFIIVQKFMIGHWCPVCLSIAACVGIAAVCYLISFLIDLKNFRETDKGELMKQRWKGIGVFCLIILGFLFSFFGMEKINQLQAKEESIKDKVFFGSKESPIDVYLFTDWACPACRYIEPQIVAMSDEVMKKARLTFVDYVIHSETLNFMPYNLSFIINNKPQYLKLREALTELSIKNSNPTDHDVEEAIKPLGVEYKPLSYSDVAVGIKFFKHLGKEFKIDSTPTIVIVNKATKKGKKLHGGEITKDNVLKAIESLK